MLYSDLCSFYGRIEELSGRLEMTDQLVELYRITPLELIETVVRLTKGEIRPGYEGLEMGVAEKLVLKALYMVTMLPVEEIEEERVRKGDIGSAAEILVGKKRQTSLFHEPLTVTRVFTSLTRIASVEGRSSQDLKLKLIAELLHDSTPMEAKYLTRTVCQKMRLGIADMTQIDALSYHNTPGIDELGDFLVHNGLPLDDGLVQAVRKHLATAMSTLAETRTLIKEKGMEKDVVRSMTERVQKIRSVVQENRETIVRAYNIHPDLGYIASLLASGGIGNMGHINVTPGIPLRAMLGERLPSISGIMEKMGGKVALEYKYDGLRVQAHITDMGKNVILFSRQLENITDQFPDVAGYLGSMFKGQDCILEGECVPVESGTGRMLPFQVISQRRGRKYDLEDKIEEVPVILVLFDCLYLNGSEYIGKPYLERRDAIRQAIPDLSERMDTGSGLALSRMEIMTDADEGENFFLVALDDGCEGVMAKSVGEGSIYQAGNRGWLWIKYKKDYHSELMDTMDLVIIGAYHGSGRRGGTFGAFLMAAYDSDDDVFRTICKLGSGFNDRHLEELPALLTELQVPGGQNPKVDTRMEPDVYIIPSIVLEVKAAEITFSPVHTCAWGYLKDNAGLALRFPRFTGRIRDDKGPYDATTVREVIGLYGQQIKSL
ncbi:MAG: ATP-dependent DNA ligase [Candidatus Thermoplasmatota archaeon]|nr:ATP-dependent DNA ligase [Candidatus Thermoplasmatota archaeon]